ncbi:MAG: hypothetical protein ACR2JM_12510 [Mycobacterium sp.]
MKKPMLFGILAAIAALGLLFAAIRSAQDEKKADAPQANSASAEDITVDIDGQKFALSGGVAGTVRVVGEPVSGDLNADGKPDAALLISNDPGGSGTFFYAVVAINDGGAYHASNVVPLGDRIVPKSVDFTDGRFAYHYLTRKPDQPMADAPTVETTTTVALDPTSGKIVAAS